MLELSLLGEQHYPQKSCAHLITNSNISKAFLHELQDPWRYFEQTPIFSKIKSCWWVVKHDASLAIDVKKSIVFNLAFAFNYISTNSKFEYYNYSSFVVFYRYQCIFRSHLSRLFITKKEKECSALFMKHSKDFIGTLDDVDVIKLCGFTRQSYYKYNKLLKNR